MAYVLIWGAIVTYLAVATTLIAQACDHNRYALTLLLLWTVLGLGLLFNNAAAAT